MAFSLAITTWAKPSARTAFPQTGSSERLLFTDRADFFLPEINSTSMTHRTVLSQLSDGVMFFSATQARTVFLAFVTNDIFFSVRQAVNHAAVGTGLVFELPIIAGSTIPHSVEDPVVYPHGFTTLGAVFHDAMTL